MTAIFHCATKTKKNSILESAGSSQDREKNAVKKKWGQGIREINASSSKFSS
jgi:hypothetical protein